MKTKLCRACDKQKTVSSFYKDRSREDGLYARCITCYKEKKLIPKKQLPLVGEHQTCKVCDKEKDLSFFPIRSDRHYKYEKRCRDCRSKGLTIDRTIYKDGKLRCSYCKKFKELKKFNNCKTCPYGADPLCKKCSVKKQKEYRDSLSKEEKKTKKQKDYQANKEYYKNYAKKYKKENKERLTIARREWENNRLKIDPVYKISKNIRNLIKATFLNSMLKEGYNGSSKNILKCTIEEFKNHIESQFLDWMSWDNYGLYNGELSYGWDLDHIVPVSSAKNEEGVYLLNHWSNFQPLCSYINRCVKRDNKPFCCNTVLSMEM